MSSTQTETRSSDTQCRILDAALVLFATRGFDGTAVPLVAKAAKVGAGTIYRYFASKEALVNVLYQREKQHLLTFIMGEFPIHVSPRAQFHYFFERITGYARDHRASFQFLEHHHHAQYLDATSRQLEDQAMMMATAYLAETARNRITKPVQPAVIMAIIWGGIVRLMKEAWDGHVTLDAKTLEQAESLCWEAARL